MRILQIIPGSGGSFYCGNCLRDSKYYSALKDQGHEVIKIPMYLPLFADEHDLAEIPVFYGAVSIYLKQLYPVLRKAPGWFDKLLNSKPILKLAAGMAGSTRAKGLEEMTISMLLGEDGQQKEELDRMVDWISNHYKPDVIHISNALLLGLVNSLKEKINVPVVCSLQDEDVWVDVMKPSSRDKVWKLMADKAAGIDAFIAVSDYFSTVMQKHLNIPDEKLFKVYIGVDPVDYRFVSASTKKRTIGYISRMCYGNGLDILIDAFVALRKMTGFDDVNLVITGGSTGDDTKFVRDIKRKINNQGLTNAVDFHENFVEEGRRDFFNKVSVLSVPVRNGEAFGIYLLESMVSGVPVVQPKLGAFPEIIKSSGGGILYEPNSPDALASSLAEILADNEMRYKLSEAGHEGILKNFDIGKHAAEMVDVYIKVSNQKTG